MHTTKMFCSKVVCGLVSLALAAGSISPALIAYADEPAGDDVNVTTVEEGDSTSSELSDEAAPVVSDDAIETPAEEAPIDVATDDASAEGAASDDVTTETDATAQTEDPKAELETELTAQAVVSANLPAGAYEIRASYCGKVIEIASGKYASDGALVQTYSPNGTIAQRWYLQKSGKHYTIGNGVSGLVLDMGGKDAVKGTQLKMAPNTGADSQLWDIVAVNGGESYEIISVANGMALDVKGKSTANKAKVQIYKANHSAAQRWQLTKLDAAVSDGVYTIKSFAGSSYVLDVSGASKASGAVIQLYKGNNTLAQKWKLTYDEATGAYTVRSVNSGLLLGLPGSKTTVGLQVQQLTKASNPSQLWVITKNSDGSYGISCLLASRALGAEGESVANKVHAVLQKKSSADTQKWTFSNATLVTDGLYVMETALDTKMIVDVGGASVKETATTQLYSKNNTLAQKWVVTRQSSDGSYTLMNANSGRYLCESNGTLMHASSVSSSARWNAVASDAGGITLVNVASGRAIDVAGGKKAAKTAVRTYRNNGSVAQAWYFAKATPIADGDYIFTNVAKTSQVMEVKGGSTAKKAIIQVYKSNNSNAQKWHVKKESDGYYTITNLKSNLVLDIPSGKAQVGNGVQQYSSNNTAAQRWKIAVSPTGGLVITSKKADVALGTTDGLTANKTAVMLTTPGIDPSSTWRIKKTKKTEESATVVDPATDSASYVAPKGVTVSAAYQKQMIARANESRVKSFNSKAWSYLNEDEQREVYLRGSATNWYITVEKGGSSGYGTKVCVLHYNNGAWQVVRNYRANTASFFSGRFVIIHKQQSYWLPGITYYGAKYTQKQLMSINPYWMCYVHDEGAYGANIESGQGFHGGYSSKGCIAMPDGTASNGGLFGDSEWLYNNVPIHTTVDLF